MSRLSRKYERSEYFGETAQRLGLDMGKALGVSYSNARTLHWRRRNFKEKVYG